MAACRLGADRTGSEHRSRRDCVHRWDPANRRSGVDSRERHLDPSGMRVAGGRRPSAHPARTSTVFRSLWCGLIRTRILDGRADRYVPRHVPVCPFHGCDARVVVLRDSWSPDRTGTRALPDRVPPISSCSMARYEVGTIRSVSGTSRHITRSMCPRRCNPCSATSRMVSERRCSPWGRGSRWHTVVVVSPAAWPARTSDVRRRSPGASGHRYRCRRDRSGRDGQRLLTGYASEQHKEPRAPQNLYPIAGLEQELRRRLGDSLTARTRVRGSRLQTERPR